MKVEKRENGCRPDQLFGLWAIDPQVFEPMVAIARAADLAALAAEAAMDSKPRPAHYTVNADGIARVDVSGPMTKYPTSFQALFGGTSTLRAREAVRAASRDPEVRGIIAVFDSPGGTIAGLTDFAEELRLADARKPVYAYAWDQMTSAALFVGVAARKVYANKGARVGSIGGFTVVRDTSGKYAQEGVKTHVIASAPPHKGAGADGAEITAAQLAEWERQIQETVEPFIADLATDRHMTREQADSLHTGQVWSADKAQVLGLIDGVISLDEAVSRLTEEAMDEQELQTAKAEAAQAQAKLAEAQEARVKAEAEAAEVKARLSALESGQRAERFAAEVKALGLPAEMAARLDRVEAACGAEIYGAITTQFKALRAQVDEAKLFAEQGAAGGAIGSGSAWEQIQALAAARVKTGEFKSIPDAVQAVTKERPDLYKLHVAEQRKGR